MTPSEQIDKLIEKTADWRGEMLARLRKTILAADPELVEEWKWMGSPVWSRDGIVLVGNPHKGKVKLTFMYGAKLDDPDKLFNAGFNGNERRAIDFFEGDEINEPALKRLIRTAIAFNQDNKKPGAKKAAAKKTTKKTPVAKRAAKKKKA